ncbi:hypothetical protein LINPERPRIM_LOCUS7549, partial [Linum perenne]
LYSLKKLSSLSFFHQPWIEKTLKLPHLLSNLYPSTTSKETRSYSRRKTKLLRRNMKLFRRANKEEVNSHLFHSSMD